MRKSNLRDCASMIRFFAWLEESLQDPNHTVTEYVAAEKCEEFKSQGSDLAIRPAFGTMMAFGLNSSCMHYFPDKDTALRLENGTLLLDSGFHYRNGTTDISRTLWLGNKEPSEFTKEVYTRSLQGLIDVNLHSKNIIRGKDLDTIAKKPLNDIGLSYGAATGHGVGCGLCVHEKSVRVD